MNQNQQELWNKIERFSLDCPTASQPFSARLAKENGWPRDYTERVILEYKRFIFLGCAAGHGVSPSEDVDQVWHLHLAYTKSYWKDFCAGTLGREFHHVPADGGAGDGAKFGGWYQRTLESYAKFFGDEPPCDIWPRRGRPRELQWVDRQRNWVIPKPRLALAGAALASLATGCVNIDALNVFDWRGPDFLSFFWWSSAIVLITAGLWRRMLIRNLETPDAQTEDLNAYDVAFLSGGGVLATNAALVGLADRKLASIGENGDVSLLANLDASAPLHPLERGIVDGCNQFPKPLREVRSGTKASIEAIRENLIKRGLLYDAKEAGRARLYPLLLALVVPLLGIIKVIVGLMRDRPVGILAAASLALTAAVFIYFARRPFRAPAGEQLLNELRSKNSHLRKPAAANALAGVTVLPLAVALFGLSVLASTPFNKLETLLVPRSNGDGGGGSGCGSGSSCGGGGCGGGCGGCGGGD